MAKHEVIRTGPEERLQRAARLLAMGAIRAAMRKQAALVGTETGEEHETQVKVASRQRRVEPVPAR